MLFLTGGAHLSARFRPVAQPFEIFSSAVQFQTSRRPKLTLLWLICLKYLDNLSSRTSNHLSCYDSPLSSAQHERNGQALIVIGPVDTLY